MKVEQLPVSDWPEFLNEQIAMFSVTPEKISEMSGIRFEESYDSLDNYEGAVIQLNEYLVALIYYQSAPVKGVVVIVPALIKEDEKESVLSDFMKIACLSKEDMIWHKESITGPDSLPD